MTMAHKSLAYGFLTISICCILAVPAGAHGDKIIPQVADGTGGDGTQFRTKFDITNLGPYQETKITKLTVLFFQQGGTPWTVPYRIGTTQGNASQIALTLDALQTIRIETLGTSPGLLSGYAIIRNLDNTSRYAEDYDVGVTVFYEILKGGLVIDTVSVPVGQPTYAFMVPIETDDSKALYSGLAIVNLDSAVNDVTVELYDALPARDSSGLAQPTGQGQLLRLQANAQITPFVGGSALFPGTTKFKGMLFGTSRGPVAVLALLQTAISSGVQYATLVPTYRDALRRNTFIYMQQGYPLDADLLISDYFLNEDDKDPWDLLYETVDATHRRLTPQQGAVFSALGVKVKDQFNNLGIETLRGLTYSTNSIDLSDGSANLKNGFTFAIQTGLGRYVKVRIFGIIEWQVGTGTEIDLQLQVYTYR